MSNRTRERDRVGDGMDGAVVKRVLDAEPEVYYVRASVEELDGDLFAEAADLMD